jgi:hypothetical protein
MSDPFAVLGLTKHTTLDEARAARRRLARQHHPDRGGQADTMQEINRAFDAVVGHITGRRPLPSAESVRSAPDSALKRPAQRGRRGPAPRRQRDDPSFTIDLLPAEAFEALTIVLGILGEVHSDDPPYLLEAHLIDPSPCWCGLELLPEAGGTTVMLSVGSAGALPPPDIDAVRDQLVIALNELTWPPAP